MNSNKVFDHTIGLMQDRLSLNSLNQKVISSNLANINTPAYVSKELSFEQTLRDCLDRSSLHLATSSENHLAPSDPRSAMASVTAEETGDVDLELEMMKLSRNSIEYQFITTMLNKKFTLLKQAIEGGQ
ncbi:MAG: flagellar basal body rod protein FlgB [Desulforhabdus sp.]|jgi:flagellar basal-body rod protein FlgB|nr:flagellar basal body rod protein FlgB [Desulforhabdus sp.]